jgi:hypothetical protein
VASLDPDVTCARARVCRKKQEEDARSREHEAHHIDEDGRTPRVFTVRKPCYTPPLDVDR